VRFGPPITPIAPRGLPHQHRWPNLALGGVVRRRQSFDVQKGEELRAVLAQQLHQSGVVRVGVLPGQQPIQRCLQLLRRALIAQLRILAKSFPRIRSATSCDRRGSIV